MGNDNDEGGIGKFIWNSDTKEFLGRDGASWGKISIFYAIFYAGLGAFFVGMLSIFMHFMPRDKPAYYGTESTMNIRGLNPGVGFRPQIDVEDLLIMYNPAVNFDDRLGHKKYADNVQNFLEAKYSAQKEGENVIECANGNTYDEQLREGKSCLFDYKKMYADTPCTEETAYGYKSSKPCVLLKMNKIIDWAPTSVNGSATIRCEGEYSGDRDNIKSISYYSEDHMADKNQAYFDLKYFPFMAQSEYRAPFAWAQLDITPNTMVNVLCRIYADNVDNQDKLNRRGQARFSLYVSNIF